jgi:hypothetical protein
VLGAAVGMGKRPRDPAPNAARDHRGGAGNKARSLIAALNHSVIASSHKNSKADLAEGELKYFHRPRMVNDRDRPWTIHLPSNYNAYSASTSATSNKQALQGQSIFQQNYSEADRQNLSLAGPSGIRSNFIVLEYIEEFPPVVLNYGMASAMFNYYKPTIALKDNDAIEERERGNMNAADQQQQGSSLKTNIAGRIPRHLQLLLQQKNGKQSFDHDYTNIPQCSLGETKILTAESESPFLGQIEENGKEIQQSFTNNLFRAPIFRHEPCATDFILIRTIKAHKCLSYYVREIPNIFICGQLEPQKIVPRPIPKINPLQEKFYTLVAARYLRTNFEGIEFADLQKAVLKYCLKEKTAPHKSHHRNKLKDIIRKIADEVKEVSGIKVFALYIIFIQIKIIDFDFSVVS